MPAITTEKLNQLKTACHNCLRASGLKPTTVKGASVVHAFWLGALEALDDTTNPYVTICLLSGRYADLCAPAAPEAATA